MRDRRRLTACAIALGYALLVCALWWRVLLRGQICAYDCVLEYWPDLRFQIDSIRHGALPAWCPWSLGGYPFYADLQSGLYAPVNWVCIALGALFGGGAWTIQLKVMLTMWIGLGGMHALVARRSGSHVAAAIAAVTFVLGSPLLVHKNGAFLWPLMYLPLAVLATSAFAAGPTLRRAAWLALAIWLCGSAGHPQGFFYDLVVVAIYTTSRAIAAGPRAVATAVARSYLACLAAIALVAALLLVIYEPSIDAVPLSQRAERGLGYVLDGGLPAAALRELVVPNLDTNWQLDIYVGPLALVGAVWALVLARGRAARAELAVWTGIAVLGVLLALGRAGGVLALCYRFVPGFTLFRIAYRHKVIFGFAAALLAGEGVAAAARSRTRRQTIALVAIAGAWIAATLVVNASVQTAIELAILAVAMARGAMTSAPVIVRRLACGALIALVIFDLWRAGSEKLAILQAYPSEPNAAALAAVAPARDRFRYHVDDVELPVGGALPYAAAYTHELRELSGYGNPIASQRSLEVEARARTAPRVLAHFGVRYLLGGHLRPPEVAPLVGVRGFELADAAPIARGYARAERVAPTTALDRLAATTPANLDVALVEADAPRDLPASAFAPIDGELVAYAPGDVRVRVTLPAPGVVVIDEAWYPAWRATIDGAPTAAFRANYLSIGVVVPAGTHEIALAFAPAGYHALLALFALGVACALAFAFGRWRWLDRGDERADDRGSPREPAP